VTAGAPVSRLDTLGRGRLASTFVELCRIESPSRHERACAERVRSELAALALEVEEDDAGAHTGSDCGNLLARIPAHPQAGTAPSGRSVMLCAHLDTVPLGAPVEPVLVDGGWENAGEGILGADNKAAVAVLLTLARHITAHGAPVDVELLFTVAEEISLAGSLAFDASRLRSDFGFVFDHATPIGEVIVSSPTHFRIDARLRGAAAHAGIQPEQGRSAILAASRAIASMRLGRLDAQTTANIGTVAGGSAINVVPETCVLSGEVRSLVPEAAERVVAEMVDRVHEAANLPDCDCDVDISVQRTFAGYNLSTADEPVRVAFAALSECGYRPEAVRSGGGSDANALIAQGFPTVNLANGTERPHEPGERVSVAALEGMFDVALALLGHAAAPVAGAAR
jgi:tripeptide aminopeptidase